MKVKWIVLLIMSSMLVGCNATDLTAEDKKTIEQQQEQINKETEELEKQQAEEQKKYEESWKDPDYDYFAYELSDRTEGERKGEPEYYYTGDVISQTDAESHNITTTPVTDETENFLRFWRNDVNFTPEAGEIVMVKYKKGNRDTYEDIRIIDTSTGEMYWGHE